MNLYLLTAVILIFVRISGIFLLIPMFGAKNVPKMVKIGFILFLSIIAINIVGVNTELVYSTLPEFGYHIIQEFIIGLSLGMISTIIMNSIYVAGLLVDRNIGFAMVSVMSAQDEAQIPVSANLYYIFSMIIFLMANIHHQMITAVLYTFRVIPLGKGVVDVFIGKRLTDILAQSFIIGFKLAGPFIIAILIANVLLGMLSKAMPGMNVFVVGLPLKVFVGLVTFYFVMDYYYGSFVNMFELIFEYMIEFVNYFG